MAPNRKTLFVLAAGVAAVFAGCSDLGNPIRPLPRSELSTSSLDFGTVAVSASATRSLTVTSSGSAVLTGTATISCAGYDVLSGGGAFSLAPGESRTIVLRFSPGSVGSFPCTLDLGPNVPLVAILGAGAVQLPGAQCFVVPGSIDFGFAAVGQATAGAFQILSVGTAPLLVNVTSTSAHYRIVSGGGMAEIPAGGSITVGVEFRPQAGGKLPGAIAVGPGCPDVSTEGVGTTVSFKNDLQPIFAARCTQSCHFHVFQAPTTAYSNLLNFGYIVPFNTASSDLYNRITGVYSPMPQGGPLIPQAERDEFRDWILEGATDN